MNSEEQVTNLKLSTRLRELGVIQESLFIWADVQDDLLVERQIGAHTENWKLLYGKDELAISAIKRQKPWVAAFTVAELGEMLPDGFFSYELDDAKGNWQIGDYRKKNAQSPIYKELNIWCIGDLTEANARAKMWVHLIEKGIVKP